MRILALDVGMKRIGLAFADSQVRIALSRGALLVDDQVFANLAACLRKEKADLLLSGLPRNNQGVETRQTASVREFIANFQDYLTARGEKLPLIAFQDESWTSELAKDHMASLQHAAPTRQQRNQGAVDAEAASIILQDFLESSRLKEYEAKVQQGAE